MELFHNAKTLRMRSHHDKYLVANDGEELKREATFQKTDAVIGSRSQSEVTSRESISDFNMRLINTFYVLKMTSEAYRGRNGNISYGAITKTRMLMRYRAIVGEYNVEILVVKQYSIMLGTYNVEFTNNELPFKESLVSIERDEDVCELVGLCRSLEYVNLYVEYNDEVDFIESKESNDDQNDCMADYEYDEYGSDVEDEKVA
ncbi:hypothetical protein Cgig2_009351 [Carnegiea gigantea]|uniref:DUF569 domain-containing protein n=1 Tax=Carnegiea gigantea TaxID=171969 RepID=A0A9Q1GPY6_9CARY|nr:hypothetical protein Cgig2_009351 [Carnegiea gigantea]